MQITEIGRLDTMPTGIRLGTVRAIGTGATAADAKSSAMAAMQGEAAVLGATDVIEVVTHTMAGRGARVLVVGQALKAGPVPLGRRRRRRLRLEQQALANEAAAAKGAALASAGHFTDLDGPAVVVQPTTSPDLEDLPVLPPSSDANAAD